MRQAQDPRENCATGERINFDLSRPELENLLTGFLVGTQNIALGTRLIDVEDLPEPCRNRVQLEQARGCVWIAWSTPHAPIVAWGEYHNEASRRLRAYLLSVWWWDAPTGFHSLWCHCEPARPTEWTVGSGQHSDAPNT